MRRDEVLDAFALGGFEQGLDVLNGFVLGHALADNSPGHSLATQEVVLGVGNQQGRVLGVDLHAGIRGLE